MPTAATSSGATPLSVLTLNVIALIKLIKIPPTVCCYCRFAALIRRSLRPRPLAGSAMIRIRPSFYGEFLRKFSSLLILKKRLVFQRKLNRITLTHATKTEFDVRPKQLSCLLLAIDLDGGDFVINPSTPPHEIFSQAVQSSSKRKIKHPAEQTG